MCKRIMKHQTTDKGDIPFYKIGTYGRKADAFISKKVYDEYRSKYPFPNKGDILISASGTIGRVVVYDGKPAYFQDSNIVWIDNDENKIKNEYLYIILQTIEWKAQTGGTIARLYNDIIRNTEILVPPLETQRAIIAEIETEQKAVDSCRELMALYEGKIKAVIERVWGWDSDEA